MSKKIILLVSMLAISGLLIGCNSDSNVESSTSETTIAASSEVASSTQSTSSKATSKTETTTSKATSATQSTTKNSKKIIQNLKIRLKLKILIQKIGKQCIVKNETSAFELMPTQFIFSSGVGNWRTVLNIDKDGSFTGEFSDSDMGIGGEDYPNGTTYICNFNGKFSTPKKIDEYMYSMKLTSMVVENNEGDTYYDNGVKYVYSKPNGMDNASDFKIYFPGIKISDLPKQVVAWCPIGTSEAETLPYYVIYNEVGQSAFIGIVN